MIGFFAVTEVQIVVCEIWNKNALENRALQMSKDVSIERNKRRL